MSRVRMFIAVTIPSDVRRMAVKLIARLAAAPADIRWTAAENLHWTLNFLGNVEQGEMGEIILAMTAATRDLAPFEVEVRGVGAFPNPDRPRTLWLGAGRGGEEMGKLHAALAAELESLGFRPEGRRYRPHLTLGRVRDSSHGLVELAAILRELADQQAGIVPVATVNLFASRLGQQGPRYELLAELDLQGD